MQTIVVAVQAAEHEPQLFFMRVHVLSELLKVQLAIVINVADAHNLGWGWGVRGVGGSDDKERKKGWGQR